MTASAMACGAALTMIIHQGSIREIAGGACLSLAMLLASVVMPEIYRKAMAEYKRERNNFNIRLL
jgi:hypothetical protein